MGRVEWIGPDFRLGRDTYADWQIEYFSSGGPFSDGGSD